MKKKTICIDYVIIDGDKLDREGLVLDQLVGGRLIGVRRRDTGMIELEVALPQEEDEPRLQATRQKHELAARVFDASPTHQGMGAFQDRGFLLGEIERLKKELEKTTKPVDVEVETAALVERVINCAPGRVADWLRADIGKVLRPRLESQARLAQVLKEVLEALHVERAQIEELRRKLDIRTGERDTALAEVPARLRAEAELARLQNSGVLEPRWSLEEIKTAWLRAQETGHISWEPPREQDDLKNSWDHIRGALTGEKV